MHFTRQFWKSHRGTAQLGHAQKVLRLNTVVGRSRFSVVEREWKALEAGGLKYCGVLARFGVRRSSLIEP